MKSIVETTLTGMGIDAFARRRYHGRTAVLAYHNIVPHGESPCGDRSLHLPQEDFARHLDILLETHDVVPLARLMDAGGGSKKDGSSLRAAITFDDCYRGAVAAGLQELHRRNLPATIFVSPTLVGREGFWWDLISTKVERGPAGDIREYALIELGGRQRSILEWAHGQGLLDRRHLPAHARPADQQTILRLSSDSSVTLASHGWRHINLAAASPAEIRRELQKPIEWFRSHDITYRPWFAFPYGRSSVEATASGREAYTGAFTIAGELAVNSRHENFDPMDIPRLNIPAGISLNRFRLVTAGIS